MSYIFDPARYSIAVNGIPCDQGYGTGDVIKAEQSEESFKPTVGAQGDVVFNRNKGASLFNVSLKLLGAAPYNSYLTTLYLEQQLQGNPSPLILSVADLNGVTSLNSADVRIKKAPALTVNKDGDEEREWEFLCANTEYIPGGGDTDVQPPTLS